MNDELSFIIDNKELLNEQVLVEYNDFPVFFLCRNSNDLYLALCTDLSKNMYYVAQVDTVNVLQMFDKQLTMRDTFLSGKSFWKIEASENIHEDKVSLIDVKDIDLDDLPKEKAYFNVFSQELEEYHKSLSNDFLSEKMWKIVGEVLKLSIGAVLSKSLEQAITDIMNESVDSKIQYNYKLSDTDGCYSSEVVISYDDSSLLVA